VIFVFTIATAISPPVKIRRRVGEIYSKKSGIHLIGGCSAAARGPSSGLEKQKKFISKT